MAMIGNPIVSTDFPVDYASGNGSTTAFTLSIAPASVNAVDVEVSGVSQSPQTYTISGTTLTFSAAPPSGTNNIVFKHRGVAGIPNTPSAGSVVTSSIAANAVTPAKMANGGAEFGMRNRIINGAMVIDQRNAGSSVTVNGFGKFAVDRFLLDCRPSTGAFTAQRVSDAPAGFVNSLKLTQSSVTSAASNDVYSFYQRIEGFNTADLNWGTANAKTVTVSFWVKSSVTGTYGLGLQNSNGTRRSYVTTYTISAANTWEYKTVTVAGDTTGVWETTTSTGVQLWWDLGSGSDYQTGTLNSWQTGNLFQATGGTRWIATSGATIQWTGVQLEVGSSATGFEYRQYGQELALCQRYYQTFNVYHTCGLAANGYRAFTHPFKVTMRANATCTLSATTSSPSVDAADTNWVRISNNSSSEYVATVSASAEL